MVSQWILSYTLYDFHQEYNEVKKNMTCHDGAGMTAINVKASWTVNEWFFENRSYNVLNKPKDVETSANNVHQNKNHI